MSSTDSTTQNEQDSTTQNEQGSLISPEAVAELVGAIKTLSGEVQALKTGGVGGSADTCSLSNNTYEGRSLLEILGVSTSDEVATALKARVAAGDYSGLSIKDWVDISVGGNTMRYRIGAFDHDYKAGDTEQGRSITMVPMCGYPTNVQWNTSNNNNGTSSQPNPYLASNLHNFELNTILKGFSATWQGVMKNKRALTESRTGNVTDSTGWAWRDLGKIWSPSEIEVYGCCVWGTKGYSQSADTQFPIFRETKDRILNPRSYFWLRTVHSGSTTSACFVCYLGDASGGDTSHTGFRALPCFLIGA